MSLERTRGSSVRIKRKRRVFAPYPSFPGLGTTSDLPAQPIANNTIADGDIKVMVYSENRNRMTCYLVYFFLLSIFLFVLFCFTRFLV